MHFPCDSLLLFFFLFSYSVFYFSSAVLKAANAPSNSAIFSFSSALACFNDSTTSICFWEMLNTSPEAVAVSSDTAEMLLTASSVSCLWASMLSISPDIRRIVSSICLVLSAISRKSSVVCFTRSACSPTISPALSAVETVSFVCFTISSTTLLISLAASLEPSASFRMASATTANPFPASPALAASIDAFNDSRLVCI